MTRSTAPQRFGFTDVLLLLTAVIWAINFSVVKYATTVIPPLAFTTMRVMIATVILGVIALSLDRPKISRGIWVRLLLLGVIGHAVYQLLFVNGVARTRAGNAALIVAAAPGFISLASQWRGIERLQRKTLAGIMLSIVGVSLVILGSTRPAAGSGNATMAGTILVFCGVLAWVAYTVGLQPYTKQMSGIQLSAITMVGGAVPLIAVTFRDVLAVDWSRVGRSGWIALLYSSVGAMVMGYYFWYRGLRTLGPTRTAVYSNIQPLIALIAAWVMLGEMPTHWQIVGAATIVTGIFLTRT